MLKPKPRPGGGHVAIQLTLPQGGHLRPPSDSQEATDYDQQVEAHKPKSLPVNASRCSIAALGYPGGTD